MFRKILAFLLSVSFIFIDSLPGTFAWQSMMQEVTNEVYGEAPKTATIRLIKLDEYNLPIAGAQFVLYSEQGEQIGGLMTTDANGEILLQTGIETGTYYFEEYRPSDGYTYVTDEAGAAVTRHSFWFDRDSSTETVVRMYNRRMTATLDVTKKLVNADGTPLTPEQLERPFQFSVMFSDGGSYSYSIGDGENQGIPNAPIPGGGYFWLKPGQTLTFHDVPVGVGYSVAEVVPDGYTVTSTGSSGTISAEGSSVSFVNTWGTAMQEGSLSLTKRVGNPTEEDLTRKFKFVVTINGVDTFFPELQHGESCSWSFPAGTQYEIREENYFTEGFTQTIDCGMGTINGDVQVVVVNTRTCREKVTIRGTKEWDASVPAEAIPESIRVILKNNDVVVEEKTVSAPWIYSFTADKYDQDGREISYTIEEAPLEFFTASYLRDTTDQTGDTVINIINSYQRPVEVQLPAVKKEVVSADAVPSSKFDFVLHGKNGAPMPTGIPGNSMTLTLDGAGTLDFGSITFQAPGTYVYELFEMTGLDEGWIYDRAMYTLTYTVEKNAEELVVTDQKITRRLSNDILPTECRQIVFTNYYENPESPLMTIRGFKIWNHGTNPVENRPQQIEVILYANGAEIQRRIVTAAENWCYMFENLPRYVMEETPIPIDYTIGEMPMEEYVAQTDGFNLINTYCGTVYEELPTVSKIVEGDPAPEKTFLFQLTSSPDAPMPEGSADGVKLVELTGAGEVSFGTLAFSQSGTYTYYISEVAGDQFEWQYDTSLYTVTYVVTDGEQGLNVSRAITKNGESDAAEAVIFTNRYQHLNTNTVLVSGMKFWDHGVNPVEQQPLSVTVQVFGNGELTAQKIISAQDEWRYVFELPRFDQNGMEIVYTVDELPVQNYSAQINGYDIINTYRPAIVLPTPTVKKFIEGTQIPEQTFNYVMMGFDGAPMPEDANGNIKTVSMAGEGVFDFGTLTFDSPGAYTYMICEEQEVIPGWVYDNSVYMVTYHITRYQGELQASMEIERDAVVVPDISFTNYYKAMITISGSKTWDHGTNPQTNWPESVVVNVYGNGLLTAQKLVTAQSNWQYQFEVPKYTDEGIAIVYAIDEQPVASYTKQINGYNITNTYSEPRPDVPDNPGSGMVDTPHTGDDLNLIPWIVLFIVCATGMIMLLVMTRHLRQRKTRRY